MRKVLVVAPHPDDETLGCGGTLLKHKAQGDQIFWLIFTGISEEHGFSTERVESRKKEIDLVSRLYDFTNFYNLMVPTTKLDTVPMGKLVEKAGKIISEISPEVIYLPYRGDIHTDHKAVFDTIVSCTKWFRYGSVKRVLAYETLSETEFCINPDNNGFKPNVYINISNFMDKKIEIMKVFSSEIGEYPFPRSERAIRSLGSYRGVAAGCEYAEAFILLKEIQI